MFIQVLAGSLWVGVRNDWKGIDLFHINFRESGYRCWGKVWKRIRISWLSRAGLSY
jgi:hypothetical protein